MRGDLVAAEVVLIRNECPHRASWLRDVECSCEVHFASNCGEQVALTPKETTRCEDALIARWSEIFERKAS